MTDKVAQEKALQALHSENERLGLYKDAYAEPKPVAWPCLIDAADFSKGTITIVMQCDDYKVSAGTHWLSPTPPQRTWVGLTNQERSECWDTIPERAMKKVEAKLKDKNQ